VFEKRKPSKLNRFANFFLHRKQNQMSNSHTLLSLLPHYSEELKSPANFTNYKKINKSITSEKYLTKMTFRVM